MLITVTIVANVYQSTVGKNILNIKFTEYFYDSILTIIWSFLLFTYILRIKLPNKMRKICRKISVLTLGVYIIHPMVVWGVKEILHLDMFYPVIIVFGYVTIASFIIVYIFSKVSLINKLLFTI